MYTEYGADLKRYFLAYTKNVMDAEDMLHNLFLKLLCFNGVIIPSTARGFVFTMARRMMLDHATHVSYVRRATKQFEAEAISLWIDTASATTLECKQIAEIERRQASLFPGQMARVYEMCRFEEKTIPEVAQELQISTRTVETHLYHARKRMRGNLKRAINQ